VRLVSCAVACLIAAAARTSEAQSSASTPEQVVRDFFKAEQEGRWIDAAHLLDLIRFEPIRRSVVQSVRSQTSRPTLTAQQLMQMDSALPLAAAEYQARSMNEGVRNYDFLSREFARVPSADSLAALPVDEAAARWLEAKGWKWQNELARKEAIRRRVPTCPEVPDSIVHSARARFDPPLSVVLGATEDTDSVRYVVVGFAGLSVNADKVALQAAYEPMTPKALVLRRLGAKWKIAATPDMPHSDAFGGSTFTIACSTTIPSKSEVPKK
jgi:hypothetical protein